MIQIIGDIHGNFRSLQAIVDKAVEDGCAAAIQVGDFGYYKKALPSLELCEFNIPVYWIDGNHEEHQHFIDFEEITEIHKNCFYIPRGTVLSLDSKKFACMGGASSIDKKLRLTYKYHWSDLENIRQVDLDRMLKNLNDVNNEVDYIISHVPPQSVIQRNFDPMNMLNFGVSINWRDPDADIIEVLWKQLDYPQLYCGHMHKRVRDYKCTILDISEFIYV